MTCARRPADSSSAAEQCGPPRAVSFRPSILPRSSRRRRPPAPCAPTPLILARYRKGDVGGRGHLRWIRAGPVDGCGAGDWRRRVGSRSGSAGDARVAPTWLGVEGQRAARPGKHIPGRLGLRWCKGWRRRWRRSPVDERPLGGVDGCLRLAAGGLPKRRPALGTHAGVVVKTRGDFEVVPPHSGAPAAYAAWRVAAAMAVRISSCRIGTMSWSSGSFHRPSLRLCRCPRLCCCCCCCRRCCCSC